MPAGGARTLSRDYKDVRRHKHVAVGHGFNGWVGLGIGLGLGLLVAFGVHLHYSRQLAAAAVPVPAPDAAPASSIATDDSIDGPGTAAVDLAATTDYGFYEMLPKQEVEVPDPAQDRARVSKAAKPPLPRGDVVLQAGSFKQQVQAEKLVAKLAYMGINARVQRTPVDDETWYRVRIGPIETVEELEAVRSKLLEAEITATAVTPVEETPLP
jgi:cell division septation protein DedD